MATESVVYPRPRAQNLAKSSTRRSAMGIFVSVTFVFTFAAWLPVVLAGGFANLPAPLSTVLGLLAPFGPAVGAVMALAAVEGNEGLRAYWRQVTAWRTGWHWYAIALLGPVGLFTAVLAVRMLLGQPALDSFGHVSVTGFLVTLVLATLVGGGQEELGWRGFALPRLQARHGPLVASLIIGLLWTLWHGMLWFIPESPQYHIPFWLYGLHMLPNAIIYTWLYNRTSLFNGSGSVPVAMLYHGMGNAIPAAVLLPVMSTATFATYFPPLVAVEWLVALALLPALRNRSSKKQASTTTHLEETL